MDLPLPVGPTTATVSPGPTSKLTSRSAGARSPYANVRWEKRICGAAGLFIVAGSVSPARTEGGLTRALAGSDTPVLSGVPAASTISWIRFIEVRPRRTIESVQPSAIVGQVRYAR